MTGTLAVTAGRGEAGPDGLGWGGSVASAAGPGRCPGRCPRSLPPVAGPGRCPGRPAGRQPAPEL